MKKTLYKALYCICSFLSNYIDNRYLTKYKILLGTSLLVVMNVTQGCKRQVQVTCYEPSAPDDTIEVQKVQPDDSPEMSCYITDYTTEPEDHYYDQVDEMPEFPGGKDAMLKYISETIQYPSVSVEKGAQGNVLVIFIIDKDGAVTNAGIMSGCDASLNAEALRVVNAMPRWKPGKDKGENVRVRFRVPINFRLSK